MRLKTRQFVALAVAGAMLVAGLATVLVGGSSDVDAQYGEFTIEITATGFNPAHCQVNRLGSAVRFRNLDTKPRRIIVPEPGTPDDEVSLDTGWLDPGEVSRAAWAFQGLDRKVYRDFDNPALTGVIEVPINQSAPSICEPLTPTPTPTITPTPSPTPIRTTTPIPQPTPVSCIRFLANPRGCLPGVGVSTDGPLQ